MTDDDPVAQAASMKTLRATKPGIEMSFMMVSPGSRDFGDGTSGDDGLGGQ